MAYKDGNRASVLNNQAIDLPNERAYYSEQKLFDDPDYLLEGSRNASIRLRTPPYLPSSTPSRC